MPKLDVEQAVFPLAERHGVGILVRVPMAQGILTGKLRPGQKVPADRRALLAGKRMPGLIERAELFKPLAEGREITLGQMTLRYAMRPSAVSVAIPGERTPEQLARTTWIPFAGALRSSHTVYMALSALIMLVEDAHAPWAHPLRLPTVPPPLSP